MLFLWLPGREALRLLQVLAQGLLTLILGCGWEPRHAGAGPKLLHTSLLGRRVLGNLRVRGSCWAPTKSASGCGGLQTPARGPGSLVLSMRC